jgi:starch synthase
MKKLKIVSISAEISPYSKTGGLADVARSLPKALKRLGHDIIIISPLYGQVVDKAKYNLKLIYSDVKVYLNSTETVIVNYWRGYLMDDLPLYFIENKKYFSQSKSLYGSPKENARFLIFDVAALKLISLLKYQADIVHCHDWHTGLIPFYLNTDFRYSKTLRKAKSIFTIHNLAFQLGHNWWEVPVDKKDYGRNRIPHISDPEIERINFAKRAILSADIINTVSEQYRQEIMTKNFGQDLHRILRNREDRLFGIVNGIDYMSYNPENDPQIYKNFSYKTIRYKKANKEHLQKILKLPIDSGTPIISLTSRVTFQKGFELLEQLFENLLSMDLQMIIMGDGDKKYINSLKKYCKKYPKKIVWLPFAENQKLETIIYAASDIFLLPSHHEPCGINQLIAMRYGCIPVVRKVGGLHDTVVNYNPVNNRGTGFSFNKYDAFSLYGAIVRALENYGYKDIWNNLIVRAMQSSHSWEIPAKKYIALYRKALKMKNNK